MALEEIRSVLGWCTVINWGLLFLWWVLILSAHDWAYRYHSKWFKISYERFDEIHYQGMAIFKLGVILFNMTPYLGLRIVG